MAGMHFIILKVNGVDVSQMPHEEAVQMFLKASEPILVEVRRRSYNTNADAENSNNHSHLEKSSNEQSPRQQLQLQQQKDTSRRQSPPTTMSLMTTQTEHHHHHHHQQAEPMTIPSAVVDSLKLHSLVISSSSKSSNNRDNISNHKHKGGGGGENNISIGADDGGGSSLPPQMGAIGTIALNESDKSYHPQGQYSTNETATIKSRSGSISSQTSNAKSTPSTPLKETVVPSSGGEEKNSRCNLISVGIQTDNFTTDFIFNGSTIIDPEQIIETDHNLFSECLAPEIDIEEITLRKSEGNERLGLTVCYSSGGGNGSGSDDTDTCTEVYISDIVPDSIAGRDGRLRQGDQILQVNGKDVSNKEETETLIAENNNAVTLLVSRYLYGDEDEYNEQGDYYEEDEPNMAYANSFIENYLVTENLLKSTAPPKSNPSSPEKKQHQQLIEELVPSNEQIQQSVRSIMPPPDVVLPTAAASENMTASTFTSSSSRDPLNHQNIRAHLEQVNHEIAILDSRVENMMMSQKKNSEPTCNLVQQKLPQQSQSQSKQQQQQQHQLHQSQPTKETSVMPIMEYDTEHIYETIPEDSESEPFYCSPYESSEHQNRIEQWLDMQDGSELNDSRMRSLQHHKQLITHQQHQQQQQQQQTQHHDNLSIWTKAKNGTLRSTNSSAGDDHENSSSAYNTGGSCNSNTMTPLTLELNTANYRDRDLNHHSQSTLNLCSTNKQHTISPINETTSSTQMQNRFASQELSSSVMNHRHSKEKLLSPSHVAAKGAASMTSQPLLLNKPKIFPVSQKNTADSAKSTQNNQNAPPISAASNTMYTNVANLQQTMLLQQQLFRQALIHQRVPSHSVPCPQFTAPNLSQYHFVSSQEVSTVKLNTHPSEEHMVWKVKRRQDGTRYIVRRPVRNRFLRNRALRINAERNDQTTEDDTISEIKTGRYWTKEERKKHIEKARERRQRQQIIITNKNNEISMQPLMINSSMNPAEITTKNLVNCGVADSTIQQQQQQKVTMPTAAAAAAATAAATTPGGKVHRQSTPSSNTTTKKLVKKIITNSPTVDANNSPLIPLSSSVTGTLPTCSSTTAATTTTTPSSGNRKN
ncbi:slo-interacting protein 1 isoform X2 [Episyrphus balteatus]|uniref:slo-interacting protein 1 isoform X2 n=1 Tax=Episyrphus balteatus TaxID=286459 RepID=UPI0024861B85|nr:slo-interacting protein 1 isoform X2 [Episyrphus balteatus]